LPQTASTANPSSVEPHAAEQSGAQPFDPTRNDRIITVLTEGVERHQTGDIAGAEEIYRKALEIDSNHPHALHLLGVVHHQNGENEQAVELIERSLARNPNFADAHSNLGAALFALKRLPEAAEHFKRAADLNPAMAEAHSNLASVLKDQGKVKEAIERYQAAHQANPQAPKFVKRLAELYLEHEQFDHAVDWFGRYLTLAPDDAEAENNLGYAHERLKELEQAETHYRRAAELCPDSPEIFNNLGSVLHRLGNAGEGREFFDKALAIAPEKWGDLANMAGTFANLREMDKALPLFEKLVEVRPDDAQLFNEYAVALALEGKYQAAREAFERAIEIKPDFAEAYNNYGASLLSANDRPAAIDIFKKALKHRPMYLEAHLNLCMALGMERRYDEAYFYAKATVLLNDYRPIRFSNPHKIFGGMCDFDACEALGDPWENLAQAKAHDYSTSFLEMLRITDSDETTDRLVKMHREWGEDLTNKYREKPLPPIPKRAARSKIRLGFVSSDLRNHSVGLVAAPLFEAIDQDRFELYCYSPWEAKDDPVQRRYKELSTKFSIIDNHSYREFAEEIRNDGVDILFELNGFTRDSQIRVMAYRPAPVQIFWLGYPFTIGLPDIDYILLDRFCKPEREEWLLEKALLMPESWVSFGPLDEVPIAEELPFERNGVITFGTMNNTYKITRSMMALWARIMKQVPDSRFLVVRPECASMAMCTNFADEFQRNGIDRDRLFFVNNHAQGLNHLIFYDEMDITLDTFPVTGGTTTCDALWMGAPVVARYGPGPHQRLCYALLNHIGLDDLCAPNDDDYVRIAVALANDPDRLRELRFGLRRRFLESPLGQTERFSENFQDLMLELVERHGLR
jgi:predicted O-linked N-acetylglucosamine transferase (SPINDLY family)